MDAIPPPATAYPTILDDERSRRFAERYDASYAAVERSFLADLRARLIEPLTGCVVEIGAGTGANVPHYGAVSAITRVDLVEPIGSMRDLLALRVAQARVGGDQRLRVLAGRAEALPQADESVDAVVATMVLCSVTDVDAALREVRRVVRPGGSFAFVEHCRAAGPRRLLQHALTPVAIRYAAGCQYNRDIPRHIEAAGFARVDPVAVAAPWTARLLPEWPILAGRAVAPHDG